MTEKYEMTFPKKHLGGNKLYTIARTEIIFGIAPAKENSTESATNAWSIQKRSVVLDLSHDNFDLSRDRTEVTEKLHFQHI